MDEEERPAGVERSKIPFSNLYLISGLVHGYNKASMYLVTILFFIFGYLGYQLIVGPPLLQRLLDNGYSQSEIVEQPNLLFNPDALNLDRNLVLALELAMFVFAFIGLYTGLRRIHHKTLVSVFTGYDRFRFRRFWFSFALWGSLILLLTLIGWFTEGEEMSVVFKPEGFFVSALILCLMMPIQVGFEELVFRGYLLQGLSQIFKNGIVPLVITTALFGLAHMGNPEVQKHGWQIMLPYYCLNAFFMGAVTLLDEGLELAYGMHLANNVVSGLLVTSPNSVIQPYTVFLVRTEQPGTEMVAWGIMATIVFVIFLFRYRWKNFSLLIR